MYNNMQIYCPYTHLRPHFSCESSPVAYQMNRKVGHAHTMEGTLCPPNPSASTFLLLNQSNLHRYIVGRRGRVLDFGDLDLIFKVTGTLKCQILTKICFCISDLIENCILAKLNVMYHCSNM